MQICQGCLTLLKFFLNLLGESGGMIPPENFEDLMSKIG